MQTHADAKFWDRTARKYSSDPIRDAEGYERTLARVRDLLEPGARVVELGCGTGATALRLAGPAGAYLGTDISAGMIAIARERLAAEPCNGLAFRQADVAALAAEAAEFDAALAFNLLHLVRDLPATLRQVRQILRPGGLFLSKTPCLSEMNPLIRMAVPPMRLLGRAPFVAFLSAGALERAVAEAGFTVVATERHASRGRDTRPFIVARRP